MYLTVREKQQTLKEVITMVEQRIEALQKMDWLRFSDLEEVQVDESTTGTGLALFYNDGIVQVSVDFKSQKVVDGLIVEYGRDKDEVWCERELIESLQELTIDTLEEKL